MGTAINVTDMVKLNAAGAMEAESVHPVAELQYAGTVMGKMHFWTNV